VQEIRDAIWFEKYRCPSVERMILPSAYASFFGQIVRGERTLPNLFLYSRKPGSGKTTIAKAICSDIDAEMLYINVSQDSGKDTLNEQIDGFAITKAIGNRLKVVLMDEVDGASPQLQKALRAAIEKYASNCRFILTANYEQKVIEPLRSRCEQFDFSFTNPEHRGEMVPKLTKFFTRVLVREEVEHDPAVVGEFVERMFPDTRRVYQTLQRYHAMYGKIDKTILKVEFNYAPLWECIMGGNYKQFRILMNEMSIDPTTLYRPMFDELVPQLNEGARAQAIIILDDYMDRATRSLDQEITISACVLNLISVHMENK